MPNTKSAERRARGNERKHQRNAAIKSRLHTLEKRLREAVQGGKKEEAGTVLRSVASALDKAAKAGVIPGTRGSRKKSRLARLLAHMK
jgi:small subunit ribosomal protein S20